MHHFRFHSISLSLTLIAMLAGCSSTKDQRPSGGPQVAEPKRATIRIHAAATQPLTDSTGNVWLPATGFKDGETIDRDSNMAIANTKDPAMYRTERYELTAFSYPVPNGKYTIKLHFAETYEDLTAAGQRIFSVKVENVELKDLDIFVKAGGRQRAYIESVPIEITDGQLDITFTPKEQNTMINALEIVPAP